MVGKLIFSSGVVCVCLCLLPRLRVGIFLSRLSDVNTHLPAGLFFISFIIKDAVAWSLEVVGGSDGE